MKAQIHGAHEFLDFIVSLNNEDESHGIWLPDEELVDLTDDEVALVLQYRKIHEMYYKLCEAKKAEQDAKGM